jgi:MFS transporter, GlpU family, inner membrane protein
MIAGETAFMLPFMIARIFRPTFLKVFAINNFELGSAFSIYGLVAMISYFIGGPLADRYTPRKLLTVSLILTAMAGIFMASIPSLTVLTILYAFWGFSTILLFWAAWIKATREIGGISTQGRAYGMVDAGRGLVAALIASASVFLLEAFLPSGADIASVNDLSIALGKIIWVFTGLTFGAALLVWFSFEGFEQIGENSFQKLSLRGIRKAVKRRSIWLQSLILLCAYVSYKSTDDFSLYASDVFGYNDVDAAQIATISFWVRPFAALAAGLLGDRFRNSRMVGICFMILIIGSLIIGLGTLNPGMEIFIILTIVATSVGIYGLRGLYFALFQESKIPLSITGSAVGFVSLVGYMPDIFMGPLMGYILDSSPGVPGHQHLFLLMAGFGMVGLIASLLFKRSYQPPQQ